MKGIRNCITDSIDNNIGVRENRKISQNFSFYKSYLNTVNL